jgi:hypothetical protein
MEEKTSLSELLHDLLLPDDFALWLHVAKRVLAGDFDGADKSTVESLTIGLRLIQHPLCRKALARLPQNKEKRTN